MKKLGKILNGKVRIILGVVILLTTIAFTEISKSTSVCQSVIVSIDNTLDNYFLDQDDILNIVTNNGTEPLEGQEIANIDLKNIETRLNDNPYISFGEIYKDLSNNLIISVSLKRPLARIVRDGYQDSYVTESGEQMPTSDKFVSRVLLLRGTMLDTLHNLDHIGENFPEYFELVNYVHRDDFWRMQIAEMEINKTGEVEFIPQVTKQVVEFGLPEEIDQKFKKLKIFYKEVLPREGWNKYSRVNLKYNQQIIAE